MDEEEFNARTRDLNGFRLKTATLHTACVVPQSRLSAQTAKDDDERWHLSKDWKHCMSQH